MGIVRSDTVSETQLLNSHMSRVFVGSLGVLFAVIVLSFCINLSFGVQNVYAKDIPVSCDEDLDNYGCDADVWDSIKDKRGLTFDQYKKMYEDCATDTKGIDADRGECANAVANCIMTSIDISLCSDKEKMADTAIDCIDGKSFGGCDMAERNKTIIDKGIDDRTAKASEKCVTTGASEREKLTQRDACKKVVEDAKSHCQKPNSYDSDSYNSYSELAKSRDAYEKCIDDYTKTNTKDSGVCNSFGGAWSSSQNKCLSSRGDINSESDCINSGGGLTRDINGKIIKSDGSKWRCDDKALTDALNKCETAKDIQACKDGVLGANCDEKYKNDPVKLESCKSGAANKPPSTDPTKKDGTGTGAQKQTAGEAGTCGKARTNLIVCDGEGMQALAGVLRIAIFVLTVIVGIAATGGIAYSAVLYAGAQDNAGNTQKAKELIRNIVIGLIAYGFMIAIITWLVPGMNIKS